MRKERIRISDKPQNHEGKYVLYRMQASVRIRHNLALAYALKEANKVKLPLRVVYRLDPDYPEANLRHFQFLLQGLQEVEDRAAEIGFHFQLLIGTQESCFEELLKSAVCVITDRGYLRMQRSWSEWLWSCSPVQVTEIEDNLIVPVESASPKSEWAARTIRSKLFDKVDYFISDLNEELPKLVVVSHLNNEEQISNAKIREQVLAHVSKRDSLSPVVLKGGESEGHRLLNLFIEEKLARYRSERNDPSCSVTSHLSAYLHFGQISPLEIYGRVEAAGGDTAFQEQLLVRRELAHNYVYYNPLYDSYKALPTWCRTTLDTHVYDIRRKHYTLKQLEEASTDDKYWNAAMEEMRSTGYMENTMRMYWGKKIIEWSTTPEEAYATLLYLNNRYFLDGRDANSYAGVGWCFGLHDRPWGERAIFGTVRYMNDKGLEHKYDMDRYVTRYGVR